ncbi:MAG: lipid A export permease/ATP-binding protein MsbA [Gammaproteobacteria bacterium]
MEIPKEELSGLTASQILFRLFGYSAKYWKLFVLVVLASVVFAATDTGFAFLTKTLTEIVQAGEELTEQQAFIKKWLPVGVLLLFFFRGIFGFLSAYGMAWIGSIIVLELQTAVYEHYLRMPTAYFDKKSIGQLLTKLGYHVSQVSGVMTTVIISGIKDTLTIAILIGYMTYLSPQLAAVIFVVAPLIALVVRVLAKKFRDYGKKIQTHAAVVSRISTETLQSQKIVKTFCGEDFESQRYRKAVEKARRLGLRIAAIGGAGNAVTVFTTAIGVALVIFFINRIEIDVPSVAGFITAMVLIMAPMKRLTKLNSTIQVGIAAGDELFGLLDSPTELDKGTYAPEHIDGKVEFRNVSFAYDDKNCNVLHDINLIVEPGESVAIVGRSGSGKSTLVSLLPRFYDPEQGQILVDSVPSTDYSLQGLRQHISIVNQDVTLFNDTILNNISYGGITGIDEEQIREAAQAANVDEFTNELPDGLSTMIGDRGLLLSGGQRQRLSIARALLKNSPILVLDEATSSLDTHSERHIQKALEKLMENRTTFIIAHRLSTIEKADRIIVMQEGRIIETGKHEELLAADGAYASLYRLQFREDDVQASA